MKHPQIGSKWTSSNSKTFTITEVKEMNKDLWVGYEDTQRDYYCRLEAFLERFTQLPT